MKLDTNTVINKLISYAFDNLLLDPLDEVYTLNRLATVCGIAAPVRNEDADYGDATLAELLAELKSVCPAADIATVKNVLIPMPRTVNNYFQSALAKGKNKGFDFLYELYAHCDCGIAGTAYEKDGYVAYDKTATAALKLVAIDGAMYVPHAAANRVAYIEAEDIFAEDMLARETAFVTEYGGVIAYRPGNDKYITAKAFALTQASVKSALADGAVKVSLLDYPVPVLAFNGVGKNATAREVLRVIKAAESANIGFVIAAAPKDGVTYYLVFAKDVTPNDYCISSDSLTACGVFEAPDCSALFPVLEKGTALSTDLAGFKQIYDAIGGVKHGANAAYVLGGFLADKFKPALAAAQSATVEQAEALVKQPA